MKSFTSHSGMPPEPFQTSRARADQGSGNREQGREGTVGPIHRYGLYGAPLATMNGGYAARVGGGR